jgi:hypothetical protein
MVCIAIYQAAFEAIVKTLPLGSVGRPRRPARRSARRPRRLSVRLSHGGDTARKAFPTFSSRRKRIARTVCNPYSLTKRRAAIGDWFRAKHDCAGNLPLFGRIFPDQNAPIVRRGTDASASCRCNRWGCRERPGYGGMPVKNIVGLLGVKACATLTLDADLHRASDTTIGAPRRWWQTWVTVDE